MRNTTRDISPLDFQAHSDLPRRKVAQNTNTLCAPRGSSSGFLPGAERLQADHVIGSVCRRWRLAAFPSRRVLPPASSWVQGHNGLDVLCMGVEPHFPSSPTRA